MRDSRLQRLTMRWVVVGAAVSFLVPFNAGCEKIERVVRPTWHGKFGWVAEEYFDDPSTIALCKAIQANDLDEIERLVAQGADVNDKGKGNMTPLLWAFPDGKLERFKKLLELGADPNVITTVGKDGPDASPAWLAREPRCSRACSTHRKGPGQNAPGLPTCFGRTPRGGIAERPTNSLR